MRTLILTTLALCLGLATQACRDSSLFPIDPTPIGHKPTDSTIVRLPMDQIIGQQWRLESYGSLGGSLITIPSTEELTLTFNKENHLGGMADCNSYGADYTTGPNQGLSVTNIIQTEAFCGYDKNDREYLLALGEASGWEATADMLKIYYKGGSMVLNFVKAGTIKPGDGSPTVKRLAITDMPGATWKLSSFETLSNYNAPGQVTLLTDQVYTLIATLGTPNIIEGIANCNTYHAQFTTGSNFAIAVSGLGSTKVNCPDDNELDPTYFDALGRAETAVIIVDAVGPHLEIRYDNGTKVLHYNLAGDPGNGGSGAGTLKEVYDVTWKLTGINQDGTTTPPGTSDPARIPWIKFSPDGTMTGEGYCSKVSGYFTEEPNNALSIFNITWKYAPSCDIDELPFLNGLMTTMSYKLDGQNLYLYSANNTMMSFTRM